MRRTTICGLVATLGLFLASPLAFAQESESLLARIKAVGKEGAGNIDAAAAWKELVRQGPSVLPAVFHALEDADPTAANWMRAAVEQIRDDALTAKGTLPVPWLQAYIADTKHAGHARRLAYELLVRVDPKSPERLLPGMLDDPSAELRRDAVAVLLKDAEAKVAKRNAGAVDACKKVLRHARDRDQVDLAAKHLKELGVDIDLTVHYGFVTQWLVAGPFDNHAGAGFQKVYPPETGVDPNAVYAGKDQKEIRWQKYATTTRLGLVDFNKTYGEKKGVVGYAYAVVSSPVARPIELRAGSNNAVQIYLNGKQVFFREEYHHGMAMDQHIAKGMLAAGKNEILVKVCQNEQTDDWARQWSFQLRICDALGAAVPVTPGLEESPRRLRKP
jgi:hypothetical protein